MVTFEPQSAAQDISVWGVKVLSSHNMTPDAEHCTYLLLGISFALLCNGNAMIKCNQSASVHTELQVKMAENKKEMLICDLNHVTNTYKPKSSHGTRNIPTKGEDRFLSELCVNCSIVG